MFDAYQEKINTSKKKKKKQLTVVKYKPDKGLFESNVDIEIEGNV